MISNSIQELFDGTLNDEQTAELLHSLSVSPEKRLDFRRHMALQGTMQRDRAASGLTSEEDDAIWGALAGLGAASTVGGAAANYAGGFAKILAFVLVGVGGYLLGSNTFIDSSGNGGSTTAAPPAGGTTAKSAAPSAKTPSWPAAGGNQIAAGPPPAGGTGPVNRSTASGNATSAAASGNDRAGTVASAETPRVVYRDKIVYRERRQETSRNGAGDIASRNSAEPRTVLTPQTSAPPVLNLGNEENPNRTVPSENPAVNGNGMVPSQQQPSDSGNNGAQASIPPADRPIDPAVAFRKSDENQKSPMEDNAGNSLWSNGLEVSYGEYMGILSGTIAADDASTTDPHYYSRHFDVTYRFNDGRFGLGARLGYGTFSRVSLYEGYIIRKSDNGEINRIDPIYRVRVQPEKQALLEFLVNYRLPVMDNLGVGLEASWGQSPVHTEAGGSLIVHWLLSNHIGLQAGGGINKYWYSYIGEQREQLLKSANNGASISDKVADSYTGTAFEARYGIFYHF